MVSLIHMALVKRIALTSWYRKRNGRPAQEHCTLRSRHVAGGFEGICWSSWGCLSLYVQTMQTVHVGYECQMLSLSLVSSFYLAQRTLDPLWKKSMLFSLVLLNVNTVTICVNLCTIILELPNKFLLIITVISSPRSDEMSLKSQSGWWLQ